MTSVDWIFAIIFPVASYLIGSIPFSYIVAKWRSGEDLREIGNKNIGGLNTMMSAGFNWGIFAGWLDFMKGIVCVILVLIFPLIVPSIQEPLFGEGKYYSTNWHMIIFILTAMAIILGHNYSIYLKFQGGRGMAALVGFLIILNPVLLLIFTICMMIIGGITKYVRPSQLIALIIGIPIAFFLPVFPPWITLTGLNSTFVQGMFIIGIGIVLFPKYIKSFVDMFRGREYKVGKTGGVILAEDQEITDEV
ncbi:MAG: glycerol-3-phosphate acyltransferase [Candidatus Heimdallarchaeota archaeon]